MATSQANGKSGRTAGGKGGDKKSNQKNTAAAAGASSNGTAGPSNKNATPASAVSVLDEPLIEYATSSKPDRDLYNKEQEAIKAQLAAKQAQLDKIKARIADSSGQGPAGEKRKALRAEQAEIRSKTAGFKDGRNSAFTQIKNLQESLQKKIKDMNNAKSKTNYKSVEEIDARIKELEKQVESGTMRLVEEKRALAEVSDLKRSRKAFDSFDSAQGSIDADKAKIDELKSTLDNPEYKALNDRYEAIQVELDELNKELEAGNRSRDSLYDERNKLNQDVNALWSRKKESAGNFKEANDRYFTKVNEERSKRIARQQAERRAYEENKRKEIADRMLEEAKAPAFEREIEDCSTLVNYFTRFQSGASSVPAPTLSSAPTDAKAGGAVANVPSLELRQVEGDIPQGAVQMKKKSENEETFFAISGAKGKKKGGAAGRKGQSAVAEGKEKEKETSQTLNVPFQTVAALLQFNIQVPLSRDDVPKTIDALREKQTWFKDNQDRVTKERVAEAEERIRKAEAQSGSASKVDDDADATADADESENKTNGTDAAVEGVQKLSVNDKTDS